jgi:hypothetical protein
MKLYIFEREKSPGIQPLFQANNEYLSFLFDDWLGAMRLLRPIDLLFFEKILRLHESMKSTSPRVRAEEVNCRYLGLSLVALKKFYAIRTVGFFGCTSVRVTGLICLCMPGLFTWFIAWGNPK